MRPKAAIYKALTMLAFLPQEDLDQLAMDLSKGSTSKSEMAIVGAFQLGALEEARVLAQKRTFDECESLNHQVEPVDKLQEEAICIFCWDPRTKYKVADLIPGLPPNARRG